MFALLRRMYHGGKVPPKPDVALLDWPEEEEWQFDHAAWKWKAVVKPGPSPYSFYDPDATLVEEDDMADDDDDKTDKVDDDKDTGEDKLEPAPGHDEGEKTCCGGKCHVLPANVTDTSPPPPTN